jgi:hypothetical protein
VFFYYDAKLKGKIKIENMASPRRLRILALNRPYSHSVSRYFS